MGRRGLWKIDWRETNWGTGDTGKSPSRHKRDQKKLRRKVRPHEKQGRSPIEGTRGTDRSKSDVGSTMRVANYGRHGAASPAQRSLRPGAREKRFPFSSRRP